MRTRKFVQAVGLTALVVGARHALHVRRHRPVVDLVPAELRDRGLGAPRSLRSRVHVAVLRRMLSAATPLVAGVEMTEERVGGARVLVYRPPRPATDSAALLWIHGGGFVAGSLEINHAECSWLAAELGVVVVAPQYRLAPEHPFPAALDDAHAALSWLHDNADRLGIDAGRIAVGGASAGGGLAATLVQRIHDEGTIPIAFQVLVYPMLDDRTVLSPLVLRPWLVWTPVSNRYGWSSYLGHEPGPFESRPYAVAARRADLTGLPPAWIGVGDIDLFHDEDLEYARRLRAAGVSCTVHVEPGMYHAADSRFGDTTDTTRRFRSALLTAARTGFASQP